MLYSQTAKEIEDDLPPIGQIQEKRTIGDSWYGAAVERQKWFDSL